MTTHESFWTELIGRIGPPIFSATLVACLLEGAYRPSHLVLMAVGVVMIAFDHWHRFHHAAP